MQGDAGRWSMEQWNTHGSSRDSAHVKMTSGVVQTVVDSVGSTSANWSKRVARFEHRPVRSISSNKLLLRSRCSRTFEEYDHLGAPPVASGKAIEASGRKRSMCTLLATSAYAESAPPPRGLRSPLLAWCGRQGPPVAGRRIEEQLQLNNELVLVNSAPRSRRQRRRTCVASQEHLDLVSQSPTAAVAVATRAHRSSQGGRPR